MQYVFDVSDTRPVQGAKTPYLWKLKEDHHAAVAEAMERRFGPTEETDIGWALMEQVSRAVNEVYRDHLQDLAYDAENSLLEELDDLNLEVRFRNLLTASVQYTVLTRCGLDLSDYLEDADLSGISEFSTPAVLHHLGDAASNLSMDLLNEIGRTIRGYEREAMKNRGKNIEKPLAKEAEARYTEGVEEFNTVKRESAERSIEYAGTDLHPSGGLPDSRPDDGRRGRTGGNAAGQVRDVERDIPERTPPRDVHLHAADRAAGTPSEGDQPAGAGAGGPDGGRSEETERRERSDEGPRSDGLVAGGEQLHGPGGGNRAGGDRLQVNREAEAAAGEEPAVSVSPGPLSQFALFPSVEEQVEAIAQADAEEKRERQAARSEHPISDGYIVPDAVIGRALTSGSNKRHSIEHIVAFFQKQPTGSAAASFMAKEFGVGGKGVNIAGQDYALWFSNEGFRIAPGRSAFGPGSTLVPWVKAASLVSNLLRDGMYATQDRIDDARNNEFRELAVALWDLRREFNERAEERGDLPSIKDAYEIPNYSESAVRIEGLLREFEIRKNICAELWNFASADLHAYPLRRSKHSPAPFDLYHRIKAMDQLIQKFHAVDGFAPVTGKFVTEDEIDHMLAGGPRVSESKLEIYAYFMQGHNAKECADFLKKSYGDSGFSYIGYDEWRDSKGIRLSRSDDFSERNYDTATLNWNQAQKRARSLIDSGRYLNGQERAYLPTYEKLVLARKIYAFQYYNPNDPNRTYPHEWNFKSAEQDILPLLNDPDKSAALYEDIILQNARFPVSFFT